MSKLSPLHRKSRAPICINPKDPDSVAVCDGCQRWTMYEHLREKMEYRGGSVPVGTGFWVCGVCDDVPNPYFSKLVLPPDPIPVAHPRPQIYSTDPKPMEFMISDYDTLIITGVNPQNDTNDGFNFLVANNP